MFLLSVTGQIASVSLEGNGASAGDTELYCKVSLYFNENQIKAITNKTLTHIFMVFHAINMECDVILSY